MPKKHGARGQATVLGVRQAVEDVLALSAAKQLRKALQIWVSTNVDRAHRGHAYAQHGRANNLEEGPADLLGPPHLAERGAGKRITRATS